jgi:serine/threonine-protein kinase
MGNVYLARRRNESGLQRLFAVKAMHSVLSADAEFANMFLDEAHIASQLHHINVVGIVDLGRFAGRLFLVMDYVEGPTLAHLMSSTAGRPAHVCAIVIDLLHGLHAAHSLTNESGESLDLVHRDVSPSNILVGTDGVARLTDFGIAKARMRRTSTSPGVRKGKLSYSAPEQITNPGGEDARVDVFAAGVVLWNALTGARLFDGENEASVILSVITRPIPAPSTVGLKPPACLDRVCMRALARDPNDRYASAAEMADDLRKVTRANDLVAGPEQVASWVAEIFGDELSHRRAAIRATAGGTDSGGGWGSFARGTGPQSPEFEVDYDDIELSSGDSVGPTAHRPARRKRNIVLGLVAVASCAAAISAGVKALSRSSRPARPESTAVAPPTAGDLAPAHATPAPAPAPAVAELAPAAAPAVEAAAADALARPGDAAPDREVRAQARGVASEPDQAGEAEETRQADRAHRRRKPVPVVRRRAAPVSEEPQAPAAPAAEPTAAEPEPPAPASIETNPYLRRGKK